VLLGVMVDRPALTLRTLTAAALGVLLLAPEAIAHPSFQMSFAATLALVAGYERGLPWLMAGADTPLGARLALWGVREIVALLIGSMVAGFATTIFAAYHFHRLAPFGVIANLLVMPVVSAWIMPMGILGVLALPFGFDALFWRLMGDGLEWMIAVALWVTSLPGAVGRMSAFGIGPVLIASLGLVVLCLLKTPLRLAGAVLVALAVVLALRAPQPDVLVAPDGESFAVRVAAGRLAMVKNGSDPFAFRDWLATDADTRSPKDKTLGEGIACDEAGCIGRLADGALVAISRRIEAFEEDCRRAAVVLSTRNAPPGCAALVIDRKVWQRSGAVALRRAGRGFEFSTARPEGYARPWTRGATITSSAGAAVNPAATPARSPDATPLPDDLDPGE
jgi:competence protein ComEC